MEKSFMENDYVKMWIEEGIIYTIYKPKMVIDLNVAKILVSERLKLAGGLPYPMFIDMGSFVAGDLQARKYLAGEEATQLVVAGALLTTNPIARFTGNVFIRIHKPKVPTRIFTHKTQAIEWLKQFARRPHTNNSPTVL